MINSNTVTTLGLKPGAIKEAVTWWQDDHAKLNHLWWVLNYYSKNIDPDRNIRAYVERHLDNLATKKATSLEPAPLPAN